MLAASRLQLPPLLDSLMVAVFIVSVYPQERVTLGFERPKSDGVPQSVVADWTEVPNTADEPDAIKEDSAARLAHYGQINMQKFMAGVETPLPIDEVLSLQCSASINKSLNDLRTSVSVKQLDSFADFMESQKQLVNQLNKALQNAVKDIEQFNLLSTAMSRVVVLGSEAVSFIAGLSKHAHVLNSSANNNF